MKISRPAYAAAALGTTLLLGACVAGQTAPAPAPATVTPAPAVGSPSPAPKGDVSPRQAPPPALTPPATTKVPAVPARPARRPVVLAPMVPPPGPALMVRPLVPAPRRVVPPAPPAPRPMVPPAMNPRPMLPPAPAPVGNDHDGDNNGGPDDGDGNK